MIKLILPYARKIAFAILLIHKNTVGELTQVYRIVVEHLKRIVEHLRAVGACALGLGIYRLELLKQGRIRSLAIGVVIFLKECTVIEILEFLGRHGGIIGRKCFQKPGIVIFRIFVGCRTGYSIEIWTAQLLAGTSLGKCGHRDRYGDCR